MLLSSFRYLKSLPEKAKVTWAANPHIVFNLALADLIACLAVIARSVALLAIHPPTNTTDTCDCSGSTPSCCQPSPNYPFFGLPIETLLRFGYTATFGWTLMYAADRFLKSRNIFCNLRNYYVVVWGSSCILVGAYVIVVFANLGPKCAGKYRLIGSYLLMYVPILVVMIVNPLLYVITGRRYRDTFMKSGKYSIDERQALKTYKMTFLAYIVVFYFCWIPSIPNLIIAVMVPFTAYKVPLPVWIINAVCNPSQGLLNSLSYGRQAGGLATTRRGSFASPIQSSERVSKRSCDASDIHIEEQRKDSRETERRQVLQETDPLLNQTSL
jgi:ocular albinism type 1 protein